ncbi:hypothetical protein CHS0354_023882 [Potamilus streckersoni]|uniref:TonB-dependent receptor n=1 Tax=Potamilus streckersoni TaxID=2493646 RepID=A0AAE0RZT6_9BIVA|nr:hypothetical protein CHS0354_023882 [Potamilus streckersoni]
MKPTILLLLLLFTSGTQSLLFGQTYYTLSGRVKSAASGEDLIGAKVSLKGSKTGAITNIYGAYSLKVLEGNQTLEASYFGFLPRTIDLNITADQSLDFVLKEIDYEAEEIVVTGKKKNENVSSTSMGKVEFQLSQIKKLPSFLGETDVIRALFFSPGVTSATDLASGFNVRGGSADQNLVLLDDAVLYNPIHFGGIFSAFNGDALKSATLYKSSIPIELGGRLSSVLDVRQRDGNSQKVSGNFGLGLIAARGLVEGPLGSDKGSFIVSARRSYIDAFFKAIPDPTLRNLELYFYDVNAKFNYTFDPNNRLYVSFYNGRDHLYLPLNIGSANISILNAQRDTTFFNVKFGLRILTFTFRSDFVYTATNDFLLKFGVEGNGYSFRPGSAADNFVKVKNASFDSTFSTNLQNEHAMEWTAYVGAEHSITPNLKLDYGLRLNTFWVLGDVKVAEYENNLPVRYDKTTGISSFGKVINYRYYAPMELVAFYWGLEPRISARYALFDETSIKASYNLLRQNIHLLSVSTVGLPTDKWYPSSRYIQPQTSHNFSLGVFQNFFDGEIETSAEGYYRLFYNILDYTEGGQVLSNATIENSIAQTEGTAYGVELLMQKNKSTTGTVLDYFTGSISYAFSISNVKIRDEVINGTGITNSFYPASYSKTHTLTATLVFEIGHWTLSAAFTYQTNIPVNLSIGAYSAFDLTRGGGGGLTRTDEINKYGYYGFDKNKYRLADYHRLDLSAKYTSDFTISDIKFKWALIVSVYNVYNRINSIGTISIAETGLREFGILPILPNLSLDLEF